MKISIVIPSYNQGRFIGKAIDSVLNQCCSCDIELLIVDGGSTDETVDVIKSYGGSITYWVSEKDRGQSHALNKGFSKSTGDFMAWICADDNYLPNAFQRVVDAWENDPELNFLYGDGISIDEHGNWRNDIISGPVLDYSNFVNYNYVFFTTSFWSRQLWEKSGGYVDESNYWTMDWELFIRMSKHSKMNYQPGKVAALRTHDGAKTKQGTSINRIQRNREIYQVSRMHGGLLCYNCRVYPLLRFAAYSSLFKGLPQPLYKALFILLHIPIRCSSASIYSIYFNGMRK